MIENASVYSSDEDVFETVVIVISDGDAHSKQFRIQASGSGDIAKGPIVIVAVKGCTQLPRRTIKAAGTGIHQEDVHPAVVVVVEDRDACARHLGKIPLL